MTKVQTVATKVSTLAVEQTQRLIYEALRRVPFQRAPESQDVMWTKHGFTPLGVVAFLYAQTHGITWGWDEQRDCCTLKGEAIEPPDEVFEWAGLDELAKRRGGMEEFLLTLEQLSFEDAALYIASGQLPGVNAA